MCLLHALAVSQGEINPEKHASPMFYCCKPVSLCPHPADRASLPAASCVEKMQELILDLLSRMCGAQAGAARGGPQRFGRLLGRLTELRTLRHNYLLLTRQQSGH